MSGHWSSRGITSVPVHHAKPDRPSLFPRLALHQCPPTAGQPSPEPAEHPPASPPPSPLGHVTSVPVYHSQRTAASGSSGGYVTSGSGGYVTSGSALVAGDPFRYSSPPPSPLSPGHGVPSKGQCTSPSTAAPCFGPSQSTHAGARPRYGSGTLNGAVDGPPAQPLSPSRSGSFRNLPVPGGAAAGATYDGRVASPGQGATKAGPHYPHCTPFSGSLPPDLQTSRIPDLQTGRPPDLQTRTPRAFRSLSCPDAGVTGGRLVTPYRPTWDSSGEEHRESHLKKFTEMQSSGEHKRPEELYPDDVPEPDPDYQDEDATDFPPPPPSIATNEVSANGKLPTSPTALGPPVIIRARNGSASSPEEDGEKAQAKKLVNPCLASKERQALHRELLLNYKLGKDVLQKPELSKILAQRKENQKKKEWDQQHASKRTSLELMLEKQANKLKDTEEDKMKTIKEDEKVPEFVKMQRRIISKTPTSPPT